MLAELEGRCTHDATLKACDDLLSLEALTRWCSRLETLRFKPEGRGFDSRWCRWNFFYGQNPSVRTVLLTHMTYLLAYLLHGAEPLLKS